MIAQVAFDWTVVTNNLGLYWSGLRLTLFIAVVSFALATLLGVVVALLRMSRNPVVSGLMGAYINVFRAIPLLVFILFVYYGIAIAFRLDSLGPIQAGILVLTLQYSAWLGEIFRAGIQAVPKGQSEAALSVGMSRVQTFFTIRLPQAGRISIPPTGNMFVGMIKDSSLVYIIGVPELLRNTQLMANRTFAYFEIYMATVAIYLVLTTVIYYAVKYLERRFRVADVLASTARRRSPLALRRLRRLEALQAAVGGGTSPAI